MAGRLLAIDKCPGIRPIGIGGTAASNRQMHSSRSGKRKQRGSGIDQLCAGLESGIEGAIHAMQHMGDQ
jgi:hypothetical protein